MGAILLKKRLPAVARNGCGCRTKRATGCLPGVSMAGSASVTLICGVRAMRGPGLCWAVLLDVAPSVRIARHGDRPDTVLGAVTKAPPAVLRPASAQNHPLKTGRAGDRGRPLAQIGAGEGIRGVGGADWRWWTKGLIFSCEPRGVYLGFCKTRGLLPSENPHTCATLCQGAPQIPSLAPICAIPPGHPAPRGDALPANLSDSKSEPYAEGAES